MQRNTIATIIAWIMIGVIVVAFWLLMGGVADAQQSFEYRVAAKCKGEASFAIPECACTVYNRLQAGWLQEKVLDAYYAEPVEPSEFQVWIVRQVLGEGCDLPLYFMFGKGDFWLPGIRWIEPYCYVEHGTQGVYFYESDYTQRGDSSHQGGVCGAAGSLSEGT